MAKLEKNNNAGSGLNLDKEAPAGQYVATCIEISDLFGVERQKFQSQEKVLRDVTRFVFGVYTPDGRLFLVQTYEYTISTAPGSNLMKFLKSWIGQEPPMGWDYCELKGKPAAITVEVKASQRNPSVTYGSISGIGPIFPQMQSMVAPASAFDQLLAEAKVRQNQQAQPAAPGTRPGYPPPAYPPAAPVAFNHPPQPQSAYQQPQQGFVPPAPPVQAQPPVAVPWTPGQPVAAPLAPPQAAPVPGGTWTPPPAASVTFPAINPVPAGTSLPF